MKTLFVILPAIFALHALTQAQTPAPAPAACCFTNPGFSGVCRVTPAPEETCATILGFLNDSRATGKSYCNATDIRGNWTAVDCKAQPPAKKANK